MLMSKAMETKLYRRFVTALPISHHSYYFMAHWSNFQLPAPTFCYLRTLWPPNPTSPLMWKTEGVRESTYRGQPSTNDCRGFMDKHPSSLAPGWDKSETCPTLDPGSSCPPCRLTLHPSLSAFCFLTHLFTLLLFPPPPK